jgi:hypothetical protein
MGAIKSGTLNLARGRGPLLSDKLGERYSLKNALVLGGPDLRSSALTDPLVVVSASLLGEILI